MKQHKAQHSGFVFFEIMIALSAAALLVTTSFELLNTFLTRSVQVHNELNAAYSAYNHILLNKFERAQQHAAKKEKLTLPQINAEFKIEEAAEKSAFAGIPGLVKKKYTMKKIDISEPVSIFYTFFYDPEHAQKKDKE